MIDWNVGAQRAELRNLGLRRDVNHPSFDPGLVPRMEGSL